MTASRTMSEGSGAAAGGPEPPLSKEAVQEKRTPLSSTPADQPSLPQKAKKKRGKKARAGAGLDADLSFVLPVAKGENTGTRNKK